ncbi:hypothetical protein XELAEV_18007171mg [Xenopus laevis]|uniref:Immunoglobulin V-set domain-containing protein n=1 Tax=Xenopus laevis TaxID=8355 RepID=A0A974E1U1_XENLA|nr:hypothetical protein XELAEV_18007171mg [Xenopus laevis]
MNNLQNDDTDVQPPGKGLEWIGVVWNTGGTAITDSIKNRVTFTKDNGKKQVYLQMTGMEVKDTAMYYCARCTVTEENEEVRQ